VLSCGTAAVLVAVSTKIPSWQRLTSHRALAALRWLGENSYEVYLSHLFVVLPATILWRRFGSAAGIPLFYLAVVSASAALGALIARVFSKPLSRWLRPATD
jgi:peptidoglycan/LPS O-acetylase OafA/YrhL